MRRHCVLLALIFHFTVSSCSNPQDGKIFTCANARTLHLQSTCNFVYWNSATMLAVENYTMYNPGNPLPDSTQLSFATSLYDGYVNEYKLKNANGNCKNALQRFSCVLAFPECPITSGSVSYFTPCELQCSQVNALCSTSIACDSFTKNDCMIYIPLGYFLLDPAQGPYTSLPLTYGVALACWVVMASLWNYLTFVKYKDSCVLLCRVVAAVPVLKCIVLAFGTAFWVTCQQWQMCSFWMGVSLINTHLVFETAEMIVFVLIAKGWTFTRGGFDAIEWRGMILVTSIFYMTNSIIIVLEGSVLNPQGFWIACGVLYGMMYVYILVSYADQMVVVVDHTSLLRSDMPVRLTGPLHEKRRMFVYFLILVLLSIGVEVATHAVVFYTDHKYVALVLYEVSNVVIVALLGWIFRPRPLSPFFFMVPTTLTDTRSRPTPIIEVCDGALVTEGEDEPYADDVEIGPFLPQAEDPTSKMVIVRSPVGGISVGVSISMVVGSGTRVSGGGDEVGGGTMELVPTRMAVSDEPSSTLGGGSRHTLGAQDYQPVESSSDHDTD